MIDRRHFIASGLAAIGGPLSVGTFSGCATTASAWVTLVDSAAKPNFDGWAEVGKGNWRFAEGTLQGQAGTAGFLVSKDSFSDFEMRVEFWADADCNSGIFLRCQDRATITADNAYEVNIFDRRPDPSYGTAAIVNVAKVPMPYPQAANRWNTFDISARGDRLVVAFNGVQTVDVRDARMKAGPVALQSAGGTIRFRKVLIRSA